MPRPTCIVCGFDSGGGPLCEFDAKTYPHVARVCAERDAALARVSTLTKLVDELRATHGIDSTGQPFQYDNEPLPLLNPEVVG